MKKHIEYKTHGTCSRMIVVDVEDGVVTDCAFLGGCPGNTLGVATLVKGKRVEDVITLLDGIRCGTKSTSCPDQLAQALKTALEEE